MTQESTLRRLEWDSAFFGFPMGRVEYAGDPQRTLCEARAMGLVQLSARAPDEDARAVQALVAAGFRHVATVHTLRLRLDGATAAARHGGIRVARAQDLPQLEHIARACFADPAQNRNRFNADPRFSREDVACYYAVSVRNALSGERADEVLVVEADGAVAGFIAMALPRASGGVASIPINAVLPSSQGRGLYGRLVAAALDWLRVRGVRDVEIRSGEGNVKVHRTWTRHGARRVLSERVYHLDLAA